MEIILKKKLKYIGTRFILFCKWNFESITSSMRLKYKTGIYKIKNHSKYLQSYEFNNSIVIILINNKLAQVINKADIKTSKRIYFRPIYDKDNSAI